MRIWPFDGASEHDRRITDELRLDSAPRSRWWLPGVALGLLAVVLIVLLPADSSAWSFTFLCASLLSLVILLGAALSMPAGVRAVWWSLFAFQSLAISAQALYDHQVRSTGAPATIPGPVDVLALLAYVPVFVAFGILIRRLSPGRGRDALIDASILSVAAGSIFALFLAVPLLDSTVSGTGAATVALLYLILDFAILTCVIWLLIGGGRPRPALLLLVLSFTFSLTANVFRDVALVLQQPASTGPLLDALRIAAVVTMAAAATTPSAQAVTTSDQPEGLRASTSRLIVLALGVLAVPILVTLRLWGKTDQATVLLSLGAVFVIILAVWRITILVSALERQRQITELVLDSTGDGIVGLDRQGFVLFANLSARRMLRCRESDLVGRRFHDVAHHEHPDGTPFPWHECPIKELVFTGGQGFISDQVYVRRDGTTFPVEIVVSPLFVEGSIVGAVTSFRDVSERQAVEELKRQFVSIVSHELRTPLTSINGSLRMLDSGIMGSLNDDQQELLTMAVANSDRLGQLVNDLLDLERLDAGRLPLDPEEIDANELARQAATGMRGAATAAGITLSVDEAADGTPVLMWADPHRLLQVLTNLLGNAIKFSDRDSTIRVIVTRRDANVSIAVSDSGRGIPADQLDSVFDRFGQVDAGDARREGGTGLGLSISKELVTRSGGTLEVSSTLGVGSTFTVTLPVPAQPDQEPAENPTSPSLAPDVVAQDIP